MSHSAFFDPDAPERILCATRSTVSLIAYFHEDDDDEDNDAPVDEGSCILTISRDMYFDALTEWLNQKCRHKIGVGGSIMFMSLHRHPEGMTVPAHLIEMWPDGVEYGTPEYAAFANRQIPVTSLVGTCCTEFDVFLHTEDLDEDDAPAPHPIAETKEVSFFRSSAEAEPVAA